jgi:hypothetical protein
VEKEQPVHTPFHRAGRTRRALATSESESGHQAFIGDLDAALKALHSGNHLRKTVGGKNSLSIRPPLAAKRIAAKAAVTVILVIGISFVVDGESLRRRNNPR